MADAQRQAPIEATVAVKIEKVGPGARVSRTAGQAGGALVLIELWQAFGWLGAADWTAEQSAQRWPALSASLLFAIATAQNAVGWWRGRVASRRPAALP